MRGDALERSDAKNNKTKQNDAEGWREMIQKKKRLVGSKVLYLDVFFENVHFGLSLRLVIGF